METASMSKATVVYYNDQEEEIEYSYLADSPSFLFFIDEQERPIRVINNAEVANVYFEHSDEDMVTITPDDRTLN